ncbi:MAG TPA: sulfatase-like hydrolase/transferase [Candidatus Krumholzibacteria bacterium]|nr:sulfatase-like hydrolase/transferase [Candidatus Krumholzibacteria bacterium]
MPSRPDRIRIAAAGLLVAVAGAWAPLLQVALVNRADLVLPLRVHAGVFAVLGLVLLATAVAVPLAIGERRRPTALAAVLAVGFLLWFETTLAAGRYGPLTGQAPDWTNDRGLLAAEAAAFLLAVAAVVLPRLRAQVVRWATPIALVLIVSSLANLLPALGRHAAADARPAAYVFTDEGLFDLSPRRNVVIVVLDSFQSDVFARIIADDPQRAAALDGFTYFPDATSSFPRTNGSMPALLTGRAYDNSVPYPQYLRQAYLGGGVLRALKRQGFDVRLHSFTATPYLADPAVADNLARKGDRTATAGARRREQALLLDMLMFRIAPTPLRPWVYNNNRFRLSARVGTGVVADDPYPLDDQARQLSAGNGFADLAFADRVRAHLNTGSAAPTLRLYHLGSPHAPFHLDADLAYRDERPYTPASYRAQAAGALRILEVLLQRMRELHVYDDSLLLVLADHGDGDMSELGIDTAALAALGWTGDLPTATTGVDQAVVQGGLPLVLVKAPGAHGPLMLWRTPVALADVTATVLQALDLPADATAGGRSMLAAPADAPRQRLHRHYAFSGRGDPDYLLPMTEYAIDGFAWDPGAWSPTGRDLNGAALQGKAGTMVILGEGGNLAETDAHGWSAPTAYGRHIDGASASLTLTPQPGAVSVALRATFRHDPPQPPSLLTVSIDGEPVAAWPVGGLAPEDAVLFVPDRFLASGRPLVFSFAKAPGADPGPQLVEAHLDTERRRPPLAMNHRAATTAGGDGAPLLMGGWSTSEGWGTWSEGGLATLSFTLQPAPAGAVRIACEITPARFGDAPPVEVEAQVNGKAVGAASLGHGDKDLVLDVPAGVIGPDGHADVTLVIANPRAPRDHGLGGDARRLGVGLRSLAVEAR